MGFDSTSLSSTDSTKRRPSSFTAKRDSFLPSEDTYKVSPTHIRRFFFARLGCSSPPQRQSILSVNPNLPLKALSIHPPSWDADSLFGRLRIGKMVTRTENYFWGQLVGRGSGQWPLFYFMESYPFFLPLLRTYRQVGGTTLE